MAMAMAKQQQLEEGGGGRSAYSNWDAMLKRLNSDGTYRSPLSDRSYCPSPKWSWVISTDLEEVRRHDIDDKVFDISCHLMDTLDCEVRQPEDEIVDDEEAEAEAEYISKRAEEAQYNPKHVERWLDELIEYAEFNEVALILHSDGHLFDLLLRVLCNKHASIREKAAEFITAMVQNNPSGQQFVLEINGLDPLLYNLNVDPMQLQRPKLLVQYPGCSQPQEDCNIVTKVTELGLPRIMMRLASSDDAEVREAALGGLLILARDEEGGDSGQLVKSDDKLKQVLQKRIGGISAMAPEDLGAAREEIKLVDSLWNACYNEPSSLGEMGILVLPGEDVPAPDVASKLFEPPLRALAAAEAADRNSVIEKDYNIVTDLGLPCIMTHLVSSIDAKVRKAALKALLVLTRDEEGGDSGQLVKNDDKLKKVLQERIEGIAMTPEDLCAAWEEIKLVESLWNACYKPISLGEMGILVLPNDNVPAPDVASKLFELPPRAWAAAEAADRNSLSEKEDPSAATLTYQSNSSSKRRKLNYLGLPSAATPPLFSEI